MTMGLDLTTDAKPRTGKAPLWLLPAKPLRAVSSAFEAGDIKYGYGTWRYAETDYREVYGSALMRHVTAYLDPDENDYDEESGLHHLCHAGANVLILLWHEWIEYKSPKVAG